MTPMKITGVFFLAFLGLCAGMEPAATQDAGPDYVVTYVEVAPAAGDAARSLLRKLRDAGRKDPANGGFDVLQSIDRPQHFVILEIWKDGKAQESHAQSADTKEFRDKLTPLLVAPYDERPHTGLAIGPSSSNRERALYVVTHVDFVGPKKDVGLAAIKQLGAVSAKEAGVLRYDVLQQISRPNHVTLVEIWPGKAALEAHERAEHTRKFRDELLPIGGSPYQEQLYRAMK